MTNKPGILILLTIWLTLLGLAACAQGATEAAPPEIRYGEDVCAECNMIISEPRFAAGLAYELSPGRYQSLAFDDIGEMLIYADKHPEQSIVQWYVHDYDGEEWLDATTAHYVFSNQLQTPMAHGVAAFASKAAAEKLAAELEGDILDWNGLQARHRAGELTILHEHSDAMQPTSANEGMGGHVHDAGAMHGPGTEIILGEAQVEGYNLQLVTHEPLRAGYNVIMLHLNAPDGASVENAQVSYEPIMNMLDGGHHGSGVEPPTMVQPGMYHGAVGFSMPGGVDIGSWTLKVAFSDPATGTSGETSFDVEIGASDLVKSFMTTDNRKVFVMLVQPTMPQVGAQPIELFVVEKKGMFEWPALDDLTLEIKTWMPTMDHGSSGNENPTKQGNGHYLGTVNFSMPDAWTVTVTVKDGETLLGEVLFDMQVQ